MSGTAVAQRPSGPLRTYFAPAERADPEELREALALVNENPLFRVIEDSVDGYLMILNNHRQVLAANWELLDCLGQQESGWIVGQRPGEAFICSHAKEGPGGCGTSKACASCGAVNSILDCHRIQKPATDECLITSERTEVGEAMEFRVRATPLHVGQHDFTILVCHDISGDKRREALERVFFHDILNTVTGLMGLSSLLARFDGLDPREVAGRIVVLSRKLTREIQDQRRMNQAEVGTLDLDVQTLRMCDVLEALRPNFEAHEVARGKTLVLAQVPETETVTTDASLLGRVLTNMVKNAFEAVGPGATVEVRFERRKGDPTVLVHNPGQIPEKAAERIFQRSFSTKGQKGRGLGTYSMKLFGEKYLRGKVWFETSDADGTTFAIRLPAAGPGAGG
jgi:signal transduction histidine kinase